MLAQVPQPTFLNLEYLFYKIYEFFRSIYEFLAHMDFLSKFYYWLTVLLSLAAILFITVIIYTHIRIHEIKKKEKESLKKVLVREPSSTGKNEKWEKIKKDIHSDNSSDWRLSIIEADTLLDEMVQSMGYQGADLGERLKSIEPSDFETLDDAWEAHKVRNRIAHDGSAYPLTHDEAKRIISLYEKVFREFKFI